MMENKIDDGSVLKGLAIGVGFILLSQLPILIFRPWGIFIGVTQILGIGPALYFYGSKWLTRSGILVVAGLVFLLNAACFGLAFMFFTKDWPPHG